MEITMCNNTNLTDTNTAEFCNNIDLFKKIGWKSADSFTEEAALYKKQYLGGWGGEQVHSSELEQHEIIMIIDQMNSEPMLKNPEIRSSIFGFVGIDGVPVRIYLTLDKDCHRDIPTLDREAYGRFVSLHSGLALKKLSRYLSAEQEYRCCMFDIIRCEMTGIILRHE